MTHRLLQSLLREPRLVITPLEMVSLWRGDVLACFILPSLSVPLSFSSSLFLSLTHLLDSSRKRPLEEGGVGK